MSEQASIDVRETVRRRYAAAAVKVTAGQAACCGPEPVEVDENFGATLYGADERGTLPAEAVAASLGCGNPTAVAELREGERVLDLGSGGGIDVLLSARRVGPTGKAYGLDMTEEMLALALANAATAGVTNVEFLKGTIEAIPLPARTIDVVVSNCVINLSVDKPAVFAETFRVLKPGGRIGVSDVIAEDTLTPDQRAQRGDYVGCIAGALSFAEYREGLEAAGFTAIEITPTHAVADGMHSAVVRASKPAGPTVAGRGTVAKPAADDSCCGVTACRTPAEQATDPSVSVVEAENASGCACRS
ncbi:arsenite S-adenosylmethyltransferase [Streptomyces yokosukanensis]|uniref:Arsenite methyltransferase n=1 Tax=Streptomyces yokosukanensis TaxID=67386 RepID=A0A101PD21_9ACTN|nr:arsenite methyltransferase [Streptomyces yokosukanensis]KUN09271.1 arsenite S-adenosylmethyltransferase [Streptomyces yokosukanensis]